MARSDHFWKKVKAAKLEAEFFKRRDTGMSQLATVAWLKEHGIAASGRGVSEFENSEYEASERMVAGIAQHAQSALEFAERWQALGLPLADMTAMYDLSLAINHPKDDAAQKRGAVARAHLARSAKLALDREKETRAAKRDEAAAKASAVDKSPTLSPEEKEARIKEIFGIA
jgi:hypothetical protein